MAAKCITFTIVKPKPVLSIDSVTTDKPNAQVGETFIVSATVRNTGTVAGTATVVFKDGSETGTQIGASQTQVVQPNSSVVIKSDAMTVDAEDVTITVCAVLTCKEC